jgi:hypothetical protein
MPTVKITKEGQTFEITGLTVAEIRELVGTNGHNERVSPARRAGVRNRSVDSQQPDYASLKASLTDKARKFFQILHDNPNGITSEFLAAKLGFQSGSQIGGMTGGGIAKIAGKFGVDVESLYMTKVVFGPNGRVVTYHAGPNANMLF